MSNLTQRFTLIIGALLIGSLVTCVAGLYGLARLNAADESLVSTDMPRLMTITDLRRRIRVGVVLERDHILEKNPETAQAIARDLVAGRDEVRATFAAYEPFVLQADVQQWRELRDDYEAWTKLNDQVIALATAHQEAAATALSKTHSKKWETLIKDLIATADRQLAENARETRRTFERARLTIVVVFGLSAILGLIAGVVIYRAIRRMVGEVFVLKDRLVAANEGLERTVEERTRTIRAILDHVRYGFFLVNRDLRITDGYTLSLTHLLGIKELSGQPASVCLGFSGTALHTFELTVEQLFDDVFPEEAACDQVPSRVVRNGRVLRVQANPVRDADGRVTQVLLGVSDVTDLEAAETANRRNQALLRALKDPLPFRHFVTDVNERLRAVRQAVESADTARARRELHTIKGNASCHGLTELAAHVHQLEEQPAFDLAAIRELQREVEVFLEDNFNLLGITLGDAGREVYQITAEDLASIEAQLAEATDLEKIRKRLGSRLARLRWQPARRLLGPIDVEVAALGRRLGKDVALRLVGGDTSVLPARVMPIVSVLSHMIRNAIDHGIEQPAARAGKPARGTLEVSFADDGGVWRIAVSDDGRGIDREKLRARAVARGIVRDTDQLTDEQLNALIFVPALTTTEKASEVSGRGEGMTAVADAVRTLQGRITVTSAPAMGTSIVIEVPKPDELLELAA